MRRALMLVSLVLMGCAMAFQKGRPTPVPDQPDTYDLTIWFNGYASPKQVVKKADEEFAKFRSANGYSSHEVLNSACREGGCTYRVRFQR